MITILIGLLGVLFTGSSLALASQIEASSGPLYPNALIIGVKKSGTYALIRYLALNPSISVALKLNGANLNEIHFFDRDVNYERGLDWYMRQMPPDVVRNHTILIEKTPGYFRSDKAAERIRALDANMKLILIVRQPVARLQSELTHCSSRQRRMVSRSPKTKLTTTNQTTHNNGTTQQQQKQQQLCHRMNDYFEQLFDSLDGSPTREAHVHAELYRNRFVRNSLYYLDMLRWRGLFNSTSMFIVNGDSFIRRPWLELRRVERFLDVRPRIRRSHFHFDAKKKFFCLRRRRWQQQQQQQKLSINGTEEEVSGCLGNNKGRKRHVFLSDRVKRHLNAYFAKWNRLFFELIGHDFAGWSSSS